MNESIKSKFNLIGVKHAEGFNKEMIKGLPKLTKDYLLCSFVTNDLGKYLKKDINTSLMPSLPSSLNKLSERQYFDLAHMDKLEEYPHQYYVCAVGNERIVASEVRNMPVDVGDKVALRMPAGSPFPWGGRVYTLVRSSEIIAIIK